MVASERPVALDAGTIVCHMMVSLFLMKAAEVDQALTHLLLNHLLQMCAKRGQTIDMPEGAKVEEVPPALHEQEWHILAESHSEGFASMKRVLAANH